MSNLYLPEGRLLHTPENQAAWETLSSLRQAMEQETVLEGRAVLCTPGHDLLVNLGPFTGTIPREEAALGIREGTAREIAILSRVGKPISFTVTGVAEGAPPQLTLSRRRAQELALAELLRLPAGTVLPATVTHLEGFGAFVDVGWRGGVSHRVENCSVSRSLTLPAGSPWGRKSIPCSQGSTPTRDGSFSPTRSFWAPGWRTSPGFPPA